MPSSISTRSPVFHSRPLPVPPALPTSPDTAGGSFRLSTLSSALSSDQTSPADHRGQLQPPSIAQGAAVTPAIKKKGSFFGRFKGDQIEVREKEESREQEVAYKSLPRREGGGDVKSLRSVKSFKDLMTPAPPIPLPPLPVKSRNRQSTVAVSSGESIGEVRSSDIANSGVRNAQVFPTASPTIPSALSSTSLNRSIRSTGSSNYSPLAAFLGSPQPSPSPGWTKFATLDKHEKVQESESTMNPVDDEEARRTGIKSAKEASGTTSLNRLFAPSNIVSPPPTTATSSLTSPRRGDDRAVVVVEPEIESTSATPTVLSPSNTIDQLFIDLSSFIAKPSPSHPSDAPVSPSSPPHRHLKMPTSYSQTSTSSTSPGLEESSSYTSVFSSPSTSFTTDAGARATTKNTHSEVSSVASLESMRELEAIPPLHRQRLDANIAELDRALAGLEGDRRSKAVSAKERASWVRSNANLESIISSRSRMRPILVCLLTSLRWKEVVALRKVSSSIKKCLEIDAKELVLQRFLGAYGYRSFISASATRGRFLGEAMQQDRSPPSSRLAVEGSKPTKEVHRTSLLPTSLDIVHLDLRTIDAFVINQTYSTGDFAKFAKAHRASQPLRADAIAMIRAATRAWNRLVIRIREQEKYEQEREMVEQAYAFEGVIELNENVFRRGRAGGLRVWIPTKSSVMTDEEVIECEREVWRAGVWSQWIRGDILVNLAIGEFANEGKLIFDGQYLRDFQYDYDRVGSLPNWLNALAFPPDYFHRRVASTSHPVTHLCLHAFVKQVKETLTLRSDRVEVSSPQGTYLVKRFIYRAKMNVHRGAIVSCVAGSGSGPGGLDVVDDAWVGTIIVECEGTKEAADELLTACGSETPMPFKLIREKSAPGEMWLRPVMASARRRAP